MRLFLTLSLCVFLVFPTLAAELLIGRVDVQKVLVSVEEGKGLRGKMKKIFDKKQSELSKEEKKIKKMQEDYKKQSLVMNDKAKAKKEREIQELAYKLQNKSMKYQKELQEKEQKLTKPVLEKIQKIIDQVSKKSGVEMTFEASTTPMLYAKKIKDLTSDVIKAYDKKYPKK